MTSQSLRAPRHRTNGEAVDIQSRARSFGPSMVRVLNGLATNVDTPHATRVAAANSLLDRGYGKPAQAIALTDVNGEDLAFTISFVRATPRVIDGEYTELADTEQIEQPNVINDLEDGESPGG